MEIDEPKNKNVDGWKKVDEEKVFTGEKLSMMTNRDESNEVNEMIKFYKQSQNVFSFVTFNILFFLHSHSMLIGRFLTLLNP